MQTRTYGDLFKLIQSLAGVGTFAASEKDDIANFINRRFFEAFDETPMWPRYLVTGEERTIATSPAQTIPYIEASKDNIGKFIRIHRTQPFLRNSALEFDFYVDSNGAHILNLTTADASSAFVTYKKEFTPFTVTSDYENSTVEVPAEFYNFVAHTAYADFLRMDGQTDKALIEEQTGAKYLALELEKVDIKMNNTTVNKRFSTHGNRQSR